MRVMVVANQKGGAGKTTHAGHLGVAAMQAGAGPVVLIDTDPQGSLSEWWNARPSDALGLRQSTVADLPRDLELLRGAGAALVIIDTPPQVGPVIQAIIRCADLVLVPTKASPHDLRAVPKTVEMIESAGKRMVFVVNEATARARLTGQAAIALSQHGTVAPTIVHRREDYKTAMIDGRTAQEMAPQGDAAREIMQLWGYVDSQLAKAMRK